MVSKKADKPVARSAVSDPRAAPQHEGSGKKIVAKAQAAHDKPSQHTPVSGDIQKHKSKTAEAAAGPDLNSPQLYLSRELTWLRFNSRVLNEAADSRTPLLERVKFLSITGSNLDEFFMKRIGGLMQQVAAGVLERTPDGLTAGEQIDQCIACVRTMLFRQYATAADIVKSLKSNKIYILQYGDLSAEEKKQVRRHYAQFIFPLVTPQSVDPAHPFPFISNLSLNLLVTFLQKKNKPPVLARIKVPVGFGAPRFIRVEGGDRFLPLEEVMCHNLDLLFPGTTILSCEVFRTTRNANTEPREESADDLLDVIESELQERRFAPIVRLEVAKGMDPVRKAQLTAEFGLDPARDVYESESLLSLRDFMELTALDQPLLKDTPHHPVDHPDLAQERSIFHVLRDAGSMLVQHPYETFSSSIERFLREAARDPKVHAIKMTLYRTAHESNIVEHLIEAAVNGTQVAVVVELQASFDEAANIRLAERMEEAGIHVTYGVLGLKTHSKIILVVRRDYDGLRRYVHVGTGNYHPGTSRLYSDFGLFTVDPAIGVDATELFNYLTTGVNESRIYEKLLVAPSYLKKELLKKIEREAELHSEASPGHIQFKMNALEDVDITRALYRAGYAGVRIELIVRDSCRLRPGIKGLSDTIRVISIVGRFLEHARVYYFRNGGQEEYYMGSADCMKRNLEHRVEALVPVESVRIQKRLREILDIQCHDRRSAWDMRPDGEYVQRTPGKNEASPGSQEELIALAEKRAAKVQIFKRKRGKKKKP
jgi:polyphosphate kinase